MFKKIWLIIFGVLFLAAVAWAANVYIGSLTADTSPTSDDLIETENDPGGTPASRKVALGNAITKAHGLSDGMLKVASGVMQDATAGTDYLTPSGDGSSLTNLNGSAIASGTVADARIAATIARDTEITATKLDDFATPDDNTDLNATTTYHGLLPKLDNNSGHFLDGTGAWSTPAGGGNVSTSGTPVANDFARFTDSSTIEGRSYAETRADLSLVPGTDVQAFNAYLADIAALTPSQGDIIYFNGTDWVSLAAGTSGQFLKTQGAGANPIWGTPTGSGDVTGPASSTDNALPRFNGTGGKTLQGSGVIVDDTNNMTGVATIDTGQGANELYDMDQNVLTTSTPTFAGVKIYDGNSNYSTFAAGDSTADLTWTFPTAYPGGNGYLFLVSSTGAISTTNSLSSVTFGGFTASKAVESDASGNLVSSTVTSTELGYLSGVTSALQTQLDGKQATLGTGDITTGMILDGTILNADLNASAAIDWSKMAALTSAHILVGSAGGVATDVAMSGDVAIDNAGATTIQANAVALTTDTTGNYVASVATTSPLTGGAAGSEGATLTLSMPAAATAQNGYLTSTDWNTFNGKQDALSNSAGLRAALSDESGTGAAIFAGGAIGAATATTPSANDNDTSVATTAYVQTELTGYNSDTVTLTNKTINGANNTLTVRSQDISTIVDSISWDAAGITADGTQCADPAKVTINSGPQQYTIICTNNDAATMYGHVDMPDSWDGGTVTLELEYLQTAVDTGALNADVAMQCRGPGETVSSTWGTEVAIDDAAVTGSNAVDHTTSAAVTPAGTCSGGDSLWWRVQIDATGTTTAVATLNFLGAKIEYTSNVGD